MFLEFFMFFMFLAFISLSLLDVLPCVIVTILAYTCLIVASVIGLSYLETITLKNLDEGNVSSLESIWGEVGIKNQSQVSSCNIFDGRWVVDDSSRPSYEPGSCPFVEDNFNCFKNGRPDTDYAEWRWQPKDCDLPRLEGMKMLEMLRGKRLAFAGGSLNRNMWQSLACILRNSLQDKRRVNRVSGFKGENTWAFIFTDYNCSIEFFQSEFIIKDLKVQNGTVVEKLRLDLIKSNAHQYQDADVVIFNTGNEDADVVIVNIGDWFARAKTTRGKGGIHLYSQLSREEAVSRAMHTWARWVDHHVNTNRTRVFFQAYSSSHFRGGKWNKGGTCDGETLPVTDNVQLVKMKAPKLVGVVESVIRKMRSPVVYLNVTRMTEYRKDAHPSKYRPVQLPAEKQDCSHWCLPGVPDVWNEMLYAMLLRG